MCVQLEGNDTLQMSSPTRSSKFIVPSNPHNASMYQLARRGIPISEAENDAELSRHFMTLDEFFVTIKSKPDSSDKKYISPQYGENIREYERSRSVEETSSSYENSLDKRDYQRKHTKSIDSNLYEKKTTPTSINCFPNEKSNGAMKYSIKNPFRLEKLPAYNEKLPEHNGKPPALIENLPAYSKKLPIYTKEISKETTLPSYVKDIPAYRQELPNYTRDFHAHLNGVSSFGDELPAYTKQSRILERLPAYSDAYFYKEKHNKTMQISPTNSLNTDTGSSTRSHSPGTENLHTLASVIQTKAQNDNPREYFTDHKQPSFTDHKLSFSDHNLSFSEYKPILKKENLKRNFEKGDYFTDDKINHSGKNTEIERSLSDCEDGCLDCKMSQRAYSEKEMPFLKSNKGSSPIQRTVSPNSTITCKPLGIPVPNLIKYTDVHEKLLPPKLIKASESELDDLPVDVDNVHDYSDISSTSEEFNHRYTLEHSSSSELTAATQSCYGEASARPEQQQQVKKKRGGGKLGRKRKRGYIYDPKPLVRKNKPTRVPNETKDIEYWDKRKRNNEAAKRSRENRRQKELEIIEKAKALDTQNQLLKTRIRELEERNSYLESVLSKQER